MKQRLNPEYLSPGLIERAAAVALVIVSIGIAAVLAAWGLCAARDPHVSVTREKPSIIVQPESSKGHAGNPTASSTDGKAGTQDKSSTGEVIRREVTVFSNVTHRQRHSHDWLDLSRWSWPGAHQTVLLL